MVFTLAPVSNPTFFVVVFFDLRLLRVKSVFWAIIGTRDQIPSSTLRVMNLLNASNCSSERSNTLFVLNTTQEHVLIPIHACIHTHTSTDKCWFLQRNLPVC